MRMYKKAAAALAASMLFVCMIPSVVFATEATTPLDSTGNTTTPTSSETPVATSTPTPSEWATDEVYELFSPDSHSFTSYLIGTLDGDDFTPLTSVSKNTAGLAVRLYFATSGAVHDETLILNNRLSLLGDFAPQGSVVTIPAKANYIQIDNLKYVGTTLANLKIAITKENGEVTHDFDSLAINECELTPTATPLPEATTSPNAAVPGLIVRSSSIGASSIKAGEKFDLSLTVYATSSGTESLNDVLVSIAPEEGVTLASGSSSQYVGSMAAGSTKTITFPMQASSSFTKGVSGIAVSLTAVGAKSGTGVNSSTNIAVPVDQPDRFEISKLECPESIVVGEEDVCTIYFVNKGKNDVANLTVSLDATNLSNPNQSEYVGNLSAGTEDSIDFDFAAVEEGTVTATITLTYEGSDGATVTLTQDVSTMAEAGMSYEDMFGYDDMGMGEDAFGEDVTQKAGLPLYARILIGVAVAAVVVVAIVLLKKRQAKKKARLEAEDEDL